MVFYVMYVYVHFACCSWVLTASMPHSRAWLARLTLFDSHDKRHRRVYVKWLNSNDLLSSPASPPASRASSIMQNSASRWNGGIQNSRGAEIVGQLWQKRRQRCAFTPSRCHCEVGGKDFTRHMLPCHKKRHRPNGPPQTSKKLCAHPNKSLNL